MSKRKADDEDGRTGEVTKRRSRFEPAEIPSVPALPLEVSAIQAQLAAQIAAASAISESVKPPPAATVSLGAPAVKKTAYHSLRLDAQGREVDEHGNVVKIEGPAKTVALNAAAVAAQSLAQRKKDNPYLAHRHNAKAIPAATAATGAATATATATATGTASSQFILDEHIPYTARDSRAKKALKFADAGAFVEREEAVRAKEERRIKSGFASGRNKPQLITGGPSASGVVAGEGLQGDDATGGQQQQQQQQQQGMPPSADEGSVPLIEWWDEAFLPKEMRDGKKTGSSKEPPDHPLASFLAPSNCKTLRLVQHPPVIKALGGDKPDKTMPIFLTKKEQKRVRKTRRQQVEQERRDKQMMGLLPAPEPKFKLSNFMRILGDQAVADPSKVEARVLQQVKQREIAHEMRNLAAKLTPAERREKKAKKAQEAAATVRQITVAAFGVKSLANPRHRFKVDMNARQYYLTGTVVLCPGDSMNLVYVEGGPKGIRKFVRLMMNRIQWDEEPPAARVIECGESGEDGDIVGESREAGEKDAEGSDMDSDDSDESDGDDDGKASQDGDKMHRARSASTNRCELLWQGAVAKRLFTGIKFQECTSKETARRVLEDRQLGHFWDLVDSSLGAGSAGAGSMLDLV